MYSTPSRTARWSAQPPVITNGSTVASGGDGGAGGDGGGDGEGRASVRSLSVKEPSQNTRHVFVPSGGEEESCELMRAL